MRACNKAIAVEGTECKGALSAKSQTYDGRFTLIELLFVIAIIAIMASILLPALTTAKEYAKKVLCVGNLKQIGNGFGCYLSDYRAFFPPDVYWGPLTTQTVEQAYWDVFIGAETSLCAIDLQKPGVAGSSDKTAWRQLFTCPSRRSLRYGTSDGDYNGYSTAYGMLMSRYSYNCKLSWGFGAGNMMLNGFQADKVKKPSGTFLLLDCVGWGPLGYYWTDSFKTLPGSTTYQGTHNKGKNTLFCDQHVEWFGNGVLPNNFSP